ncbi:MAG: hypothetical protein IPP04_20590 [Saprospiraceae bacterium]|nr:hypothetical protein [Saprospiraceae bacterium]
MSVDNIYKNYGFEIKDEGDNIKTFLYKKGRYFGVDIIPLIESDEIELKTKNIYEKYSKLGYAVNIKSFKNEDEIEIELFKSFFSYESTISRLKRKYLEFEEKQVKSLLGNKYVYIQTPYELYDGDDSESSTKLLDYIDAIIKRDSPQLIILEAAAGYGKTCAAFEILNSLTSHKELVIAPLFTELAKNRGAKIFRYILLDEIDNEFPTLNSELVIHEIKSGRIPLIIDGFDELLDKVNLLNVDVSSRFDEIETMLDTIGNLLTGKSKIILTTRKTAIFSGLEFDKWFQQWHNKFRVTRFSLKEPKVKDWIGIERFEIVKEHNVPIQYVANPVILTYLRNVEDEDFMNLIINPELLINNYFNKMLERERERQNLIISVEKQYEIFKNLAKMLLDFDIMVESKEFFKEIIKDQNFKLLEYTRTLYTGQNKPSVENLVNTLATHALLDRKGRDESQIGFINDFVFGVLIGEIICESSVDKIERDYSYYMLDLACTAYKVQNKKNKFTLWGKVDGVRHKLQPISLFTYDIALREALVRDYSDLIIDDRTFFNITFENYTIKSTVFLNCYFKNCSFDSSIFNGVSFVECTFNNCVVRNQEFLDSSKEISLIKSKLIKCQILENYEYHLAEDKHIFNELEIEVLRRIWQVSGTKSQHVLKVYQFLGKSLNKDVARSLNKLEAEGFIQIKGSHINFNINKLSIIKSELGI